MARPRKWNSEAERIAAYRARKKQDVDPALPVVDVQDDIEPATTPSPPPGMPDLETYVAEAVYMAELHHSQTSPNASMSTKSLAETIERAESYARWRYAGVLDGSVNGL
jgi:hypothetical protein